MKIRPVKRGDAPQIIKLITEVWAEYDCRLDAENEDRYLLAPDEYFRSQNGEFWVAENDEKIIVATVAVLMLNETTAELKTLYVHRDYRKKGLGEKLTRMTIDFAGEKGAGEMILWSDTRFTKAHRLYERLGFERIGKRELNDLNNSIEFGFRLQI